MNSSNYYRKKSQRISFFTIIFIVLFISSMSPGGFVKCKDDGGSNNDGGGNNITSNDNIDSNNNNNSTDTDIEIEINPKLDLNNAPLDNPLTSEFLTQIYNHCLRHKRCSHTYGLDSGIVNRTLFDYLAEKVVTKYESYLFPLITLGTLGSQGQILEYIWPLILVTEAQENIPLCPLDHELRVRLDGTTECALSPSTRSLSSRATGCVMDEGDDSQAGVSDTTLALLYVLIAAAVIILIILFWKSFPSFLDLRVNGPLAKYRIPEFVGRGNRQSRLGNNNNNNNNNNNSNNIGAPLTITEGRNTLTTVHVNEYDNVSINRDIVISSVKSGSINNNGTNAKRRLRSNETERHNNNNTNTNTINQKNEGNDHEESERIIISSKKTGRRLLR